MDYISLFIAKCLSSLGSFLGSLGTGSTSSLASTTSVAAGTETVNYGTATLNGSDGFIDSSVGSAVTFSGTSVISNAFDAYEQAAEQVQVTQAYIETLDEDELLDLIDSLEEKVVDNTKEEDVRVLSLSPKKNI